MNSKKLIWLLAFSLGLNVALAVYAIGNHQRGSDVAKSSPVKSQYLLQFDETKLNLTPAQSQAFARIRKHWEQEEYNRRVKSIDCMILLAQQLINDDLTTATLQPNLSGVSECSDAFYLRLIHALRAHREVLDKNQNEMFTHVLERRYQELRGMMTSNRERYMSRLQTQ